MKILITGSKGFVGKNLVAELRNRGYKDIFEFDVDTDKSLLDEYTKQCEFVFHLAGLTVQKMRRSLWKEILGLLLSYLHC